MFMNMSYRGKLLLFIMPVVIIGLVAIGMFAYVGISEVIEDELSKSMLATTGETANTINTWLNDHVLEPEAVATSPVAKNINADFSSVDAMDIGRYKFLRAKYPDVFQDVYAANREGEFHTVMKKGEEYTLAIGNIKTREYFQAIMAGGANSNYASAYFKNQWTTHYFYGSTDKR